MCSFHFSTKPLENIDFLNFYIQKRGPDHTSVVHRGSDTFIHNLLSMTGTFTPQPQVDNDIYVLFNGEIYNFQQFGDFDNDSKCIIPLYKKYGKEFPKHLNGEFSIVLVDYKENIILITTDVFATKPLWIAVEDGHFAASSYESSIKCSDFVTSEKVPANTTRVYSLKEKTKIYEASVYDFELTQWKDNFNDWNVAFEKSIKKRCKTNVREGIFIGLSSGYDSGAIACELNRQNIKYKAYTLLGTENNQVLDNRYKLLKCDVTLCNKSDTVLLSRGIKWINENVEEFYYKTWTLRSNYNEFNLRLHDDNGSIGLSAICSLAKADNKKIYLSGQGADELFSDYGFNGVSRYNHSNFGGLFPQDLKTIFPWPSFFGSSMISYLCKEEYIGGSYGLEARYPFLDVDVVQEFLWLSQKIKNENYKSPLYNYLTINKFPFAKEQKIGF